MSRTFNLQAELGGRFHVRVFVVGGGVRVALRRACTAVIVIPLALVAGIGDLVCLQFRLELGLRLGS